jgi:hypothetical protein
VAFSILKLSTFREFSLNQEFTIYPHLEQKRHVGGGKPAPYRSQADLEVEDSSSGGRSGFC